jgi:hypothetical protein
VHPERLEFEWEARVLGIVATLIESGAFDWEDLRSACLRLRTSDAAGSWCDGASDDDVWRDLDDWGPALRRLLVERGLLSVDHRLVEHRHG